MKTMFKAISMVLFLSVIFSSCVKFEDGGMFSIHTIKHRLVGDWVLESFSINGTDATTTAQASLGSDYKLSIKKDDTFSFVSNGFTVTGTWKLGEDKDDIFFTDSNNVIQVYRLLRVKNKEIWWKQTQSNGDVYEYHYKAA
ncbi:MAG: hypothetical protein K1X56_10465 [Flavobacteriales bacterium]|nr:hypothetical protein [Flavobacteriales bacterium]